jgi:tetratricopeptide (TPR) repeat protein
MNRYSGLVATLFATTFTLMVIQPYALAQSFQQVETIARQVTVQIDGQAPGSGVIVARQGQTYFVLTAAHVVASADEYDVIAPDGKKYPIDYKQVKKFPGVDLALVPFTSPQSYRVVEIGSSIRVKESTPAYIAGFPARESQTRYQFSPGEVLAQAARPLASSYALAYLNDTFAGMSGGPILNQQGQLIGIHGASKTQFVDNQGLNPETGSKAGLNLGIPIDTFLRLIPQILPTLKFPAVPSRNIATQTSTANLFIQAVEQIIADNNNGAMTTLEQVLRLQPNYAAAYYVRAWLKDSKGALTDLDQAIRLNPNSALAYNDRGIIRTDLQNYTGALTDFDQAIRLNPNYTFAYSNRGVIRADLRDYRGAIADLDQAIRLNPNSALAYNNRAATRADLQDYRGALADLNEAIRLNPNDARSHYNRGLIRARLQDYQGAMTDLDQAVRLNPNNALAYYNRGDTRAKLQDSRGAIADFQRAAELARALGNTQVYEAAVDNLRRLQR